MPESVTSTATHGCGGQKKWVSPQWSPGKWNQILTPWSHTHMSHNQNRFGIKLVQAQNRVKILEGGRSDVWLGSSLTNQIDVCFLRAHCKSAFMTLLRTLSISNRCFLCTLSPALSTGARPPLPPPRASHHVQATTHDSCGLAPAIEARTILRTSSNLGVDHLLGFVFWRQSYDLGRLRCPVDFHGKNGHLLFG